MMFPYRNPRHDPESARAIVELISWPFRWGWRKLVWWLDKRTVSEEQWLSMFSGGHHSGLFVREDTPGVNPRWDLPPTYSFDPSAADQAAMLGLDEPREQLYLPGMEDDMLLSEPGGHGVRIDGPPLTAELERVFHMPDARVTGLVVQEPGTIKVAYDTGEVWMWIAARVYPTVGDV